MKYHIDTIPVWDALKLEGECFLCALRRKTELGEAERYLGASVMEPDTRIQVNRKGFCPRHQEMLFGMRKAAAAYSEASLLDRLSKKGQSAKQAFEKAAEEIASLSHSCIMCDSIEDNMNRYLHTFFHLYQTDTEFRTRLRGSKGVCLPHMADLLRAAPEELPAKEVAPFTEMLTTLEQQNLDRIQEDVSWFIRKFDYRFSAEPWKNSQDAVERSVNKLRGWCVGQEPNPKE